MVDIFFQGSKRGEMQELKDHLNHQNKEKKKEAVKKVIAAMTVGKDVSQLFPDVVNCLQTSSIDLKKLVYLYVINYAKVQPELAVLAVNTFRRDSQDPNPLIRALAIRTMSCINLEQVSLFRDRERNNVTEYLIDPLRRCCKDEDPYVRKTAVLAVAKLHVIAPNVVLDAHQGFLGLLHDMISDSNPAVVMNAVSALIDIGLQAGKSQLRIGSESLTALLAALNDCNEWGQIVILDALAVFYEPADPRDCRGVLERVTGRLSHGNSAVVLSTIRLMMRLLDHVSDPEMVRQSCRRMSAPLVSMLGQEPELQYIALRNILLILQRQPSVLQGEMRAFFCRYNEPAYVRMEKLDVLVQLTNERNVDQVLLELRDYAGEVDVEFVRKAVRAIGRCAIKLPKAADQCVQSLLQLVETRVSYVVQEATIVLRDVLRKYPNRYEGAIAALCSNLDSLDEPEARAAMVWILGEYAERIEGVSEIMGSFLNSLLDEPYLVQMQLLVATVKMFLKLGAVGSLQPLLSRVLKACSDEVDHPDLRDRALFYWRLLAADSENAKQVVIGPRPTVKDDLYVFEGDILDNLLKNLGTLASAYHRVPESFIDRASMLPATPREGEEEDEVGIEEVADRLQKIQETTYEERSNEGDSDTDDEDTSSESSEEKVPELPIQKELVLKEETPGTGGHRGLRAAGGLGKKDNQKVLLMTVGNFGPTPMSDWAIQFNKSSFGLAPAQNIVIPSGKLPPSKSCEVEIPLIANKLNSGAPPGDKLTLQVALKNSTDVFVFTVPYSLHVVLDSSPHVKPSDFADLWKKLESTSEVALFRSGAALSCERARLRLRQASIFHTHTKQSDQGDAVYLSATTVNRLPLLLELAIKKGGVDVRIQVRSPQTALLPHFVGLVRGLLALQTSQRLSSQLYVELKKRERGKEETSQRGEILILRAYRDNVSRLEAQLFCNRLIASKEAKDRPPVLQIGSCHYAFINAGEVTLVAMTKDNVNLAMTLKVLLRLADILKTYFGNKPLDENQVRRHFTLIYELLDEVVDFGYAQITEQDILKSYITQGGPRPNLDLNDEAEIRKITVAATGATSWRAEGIKYKKNEVYIDVIESVNVLLSTKGTLLRADVSGQVMVKCLLSGMPECKFGMNDKLVMAKHAVQTASVSSSQDKGIALDDVRFHQCVRLSKFDLERAITFIPPDGTFELMTYRITENINCPFKILPIVQERGRSKVEISVRIKSVYERSIFATNVVVRIPCPKHTAKATVTQSSSGKARFETSPGPVGNTIDGTSIEGPALMWRIKRFPGDVEYTLSAEVELASTVSDKPWAKPPIALEFQVPMFTASGLRVRFLRVQEKANYKPIKWIRYITKAGTYHHRI